MTCSPPVNTERALRISGSNTVYPFAQGLAEAFHAMHPDIAIRVTADGTARGIKWAGEGEVSGLAIPLQSTAASFPAGDSGPTNNGEHIDIGFSSRDLLNEEREAYTALHSTRIAIDGIVVATHLGLGVANLTRAQLRDVYAGRITNWMTLGGPNAPIVVITRNPISGTGQAWQVLVMGSDTIVSSATVAGMNEDVPGLIASTNGSIGYLSTDIVDATMMTVLTIDGVAPSEATFRDNSYWLNRPYIFVTQTTPTPLQQEFLDFALSPAGAAIIRMRGSVVPAGG